MTRKRKRNQRGMTLIELMIAMFVLVVGMLGSLSLIYMALVDNNRSRLDTTGTMLAQQVIEQVNAVDVTSSVKTVPITDCAGNALTISVEGDDTGKGSTLVANAASPDYGRIDWSKAAVNGYSYQFQACDNSVYDVRWHIKTISDINKLVITSARRIRAGNTQSRFFAPPVSLRTISGP